MWDDLGDGTVGLQDGDEALHTGGWVDLNGAVALYQAQNCLCLPIRFQHSHPSRRHLCKRMSKDQTALVIGCEVRISCVCTYLLMAREHTFPYGNLARSARSRTESTPGRMPIAQMITAISPT